jgi:hypothetical protein
MNSKVLYFGVNTDFSMKLSRTCGSFNLHFKEIVLDDSEINFDWKNYLSVKPDLIILDFGLSDLRVNKNFDVKRKLAIGKLILELSNFATELRKNNKSCMVSAVGPIDWSTRILYTSQFNSPLFNNYGLIITGTVRNKSLIDSKLGLRLKMLKFSVAGQFGLRPLIGKYFQRTPKSIKKLLRPFVYWLLRSTAALR